MMEGVQSFQQFPPMAPSRCLGIMALTQLLHSLEPLHCLQVSNPVRHLERLGEKMQYNMANAHRIRGARHRRLQHLQGHDGEADKTP